MRRFAVTSVVVLAVSGGCTWTSELDEARREAAQCRMQTEALQQELETERSAHGSLKLQKDRLEAENRSLEKKIEELRQREGELDQELAATREEVARAQRDLDAQRAELEKASAAIRRSREQWEQTLADRQKRIDVLANELERLKERLARSGRDSMPASQPG